MEVLVKKLVISVGLLGALIWLVLYSWELKTVENGSYVYSKEEIKGLAHIPEANYAYGLKAWYENQPAAARIHFRQAVSANVLHIDAWLKLAQAEADLGHTDKAKQILRFTDQLTRDVIKWKWEHILLARELGVEAVFLKNINFVIPDSKLQSDALQLLDMYYGNDAARVLPVITMENKPHYLDWLIRWRRTADARLTWQAISAAAKEKHRLYADYVHFLVREKKIQNAARIWRAYTGISGMTNPGFEEELSQRGFDWAYWGQKNSSWDIERDSLRAVQGRYTLKIRFDGTENLNFYHLRQIVPVQPGQPHKLSYWWKSYHLTTDQRPFIELYGYDCKSRRWQSEMVRENEDWHKASICFSPPKNCQAVVVRLRRKPSHRFDSKIDGELWLDGFELRMIGSETDLSKYKGCNP